MSDDKRESAKVLTEALDRVGLRSTRQRDQVYEALLSMRTHPTAEEVFSKARESMSTISLATVYNCIETLVDCGLVKAVHRERGPTRYCANRSDHAHFHDTFSGEVMDVEMPGDVLQYLRMLVPPGYELDRVDLNFIGHRAEPSARPAR
ncbi:MAG: transcriptional repressor [Opitutales bacterium]|jgi:Fur family peroxide stress response transcriptional regulator